MKTHRRRLGGILAIVTMLALGCSTPSSLMVTVQPGGRFQVGRDTVTLEQLPVALKKARATAATEIVVSTPSSTSNSARTAIQGSLSSAGYRKIMFRGPLRTEVYTGKQ